MHIYFPSLLMCFVRMPWASHVHVPFIRHEKPVLSRPSSWHAVIKKLGNNSGGLASQRPSSKCSFLSASLLAQSTLVPTHWLPGSLQALQTISELLKSTYSACYCLSWVETDKCPPKHKALLRRCASLGLLGDILHDYPLAVKRHAYLRETERV